MSCRAEIHAAVESVLSADKTFFGIDEVLGVMLARNTAYSPSTIRTQICSALCVNAPSNHATRYPDFERIGPNMYRPHRGVAGAEMVTPKLLPAAAFEAHARIVMEDLYGQKLGAAKVPGLPKRFDFVSADGSIVGDAKFYALVNGVALPPAKHSVIAEYVWLLEKTQAQHRFLVFGNDRRVPQGWLKRFGALTDVRFYFIKNDGTVAELQSNAEAVGE